jgi:hypothetical protein
MIYPFNSPVILNDSIFSAFGGNLDTTTPAVRQYAYNIAEMFVSEELNTLLLPHRVTGTYSYSPIITLDHSYVQSVDVVRFLDTKEECYWSQNGTANIYVSLKSSERGLVDLHYTTGWYHGHDSCIYPYQVQIVYTAGLSTGTANQSDILMALVTYSKIILNELIGYGNESSGDIGVQSFKNIQYSEERVKLLRTNFGTSAQAQFIAGLLKQRKRRQHVGL